MPWNGLGTYSLPPAYSPEVNGTVIDAVRYNGLTTDAAAGITNCLTKDGQNVPTNNIPWGGFKITGLAQAAALGDALSWGRNGSFADLAITNSFSTAVAAPSTFAGTVSFSNTVSFTGTILLPPGLVGTPSLSFTGDTNTGYWSPGADTVAWSTGGAERMRIDSSGRVGIGRTAAAAPLELLGLDNVASTYIAKAYSNNATAYAGLTFTGIRTSAAFNLYVNDSTTASVFVTAAGLMGIGRSPVNELDVVGGAGGTRLALDTTADGVGAGGTILYYKFGTLRGSTGVRANRYGDNSGDFLIQSVSDMVFNTGAGVGTEAMRIGTSQLVGIGRTAGTKLDVLGVNNSTSFGGNGDFRISSLNATVSTQYGWNQLLSTGTYFVGINSVEKARFTTTALFLNPDGAGTTSQASGLEVCGTANTVIVRGAPAASYQGIRIYNDQNNSSRSLEMDYSGSAYAGAFMTNGPTGEQGAICTTGAFPLVLGAANAAKVVISSATGTPMYQVLNGGAYNCIVDPGGVVASMPVGCIVAGQRSGAGTSVANLQTFVATGANFFIMANADGTTTNVQTGTWRVLGQITGTFCIFHKVA